MGDIFRESWWRRLAPAVFAGVLAVLGVLVLTGVYDMGPGTRTIPGLLIIAMAAVRLPAILRRAWPGGYVRVADDGVHGCTWRTREWSLPWHDIQDISVVTVGEGRRDGFRYPELALADGTKRPLRIMASALRRSADPRRIFKPAEAMYDSRFDTKVESMRAYLARHHQPPTTP